MGLHEVFEYIKTVGGPLSPILFLALLWLDRERNKLIKRHDEEKEALNKRIDAKDAKLEQLAQSTVIVMAEFKAILLGRKEAA